MPQSYGKTQAGDCINSSLFWLEGLVDGTNLTRAEALALLAMAIGDLQDAYQRLMYEE